MLGPKSSRALRWLPAVAALAVFGRVVLFPFVEWDDATYLRANPLIAGGEAVNLLDYLFTPQMGYVIPVTVAVERLLYLIGGGAAWPFHLLAVLLHAANAILLARLAERLGAGPRSAVAAATLWAIHPIVAEPVSWATGLKDVLALTFTLASVLAYVGDKTGRAILFGALAFFSKPTTVLLPVALAVLPERRVRALVGLGLAAGLAGTLSFVMRSVQIADRHGDAGGAAAHPLVVLISQIENYIGPLDLHPAYAVTSVSFYYWTFGVAVVALTIFLVVYFQGARRFALVLAIAAYLPSSQLIPFPRGMADSFVYAPTAALWVLVALATVKKKARLLPFGIVLGIVLALLSVRQSARWRSNEALWLPLVQAEPGWAYPHILLAQGYWSERRIHDATYLYEQAFARQYAPQYLSAYAEALYADWRFADARCVFEEDVLHGINEARARRNLNRFWELFAKVPWNGVLAPRPAKQCEALHSPIQRIRVP